MACRYLMFASEDIARELSRSNSGTGGGAVAARTCNSPRHSSPANARTVKTSPVLKIHELYQNWAIGSSTLERHRDESTITFVPEMAGKGRHSGLKTDLGQELQPMCWMPDGPSNRGDSWQLPEAGGSLRKAFRRGPHATAVRGALALRRFVQVPRAPCD